MGTGIKTEDIMLRHHSDTDYPGFGFVDCGSTERASSLVDKLNMTTLKGDRMIWVTWIEWREPVHTETFGKKVYFKKIHHSMTKEELRQKCLEFGTFSYNPRQCFKFCEVGGYAMNEATVTMISNEDAKAVCEGLNGHKVGGLKMITIGKPSKANRQKYG